MSSHRSFLRGFRDNILQCWFKMKTASIFPVHGLASLRAISIHAASGIRHPDTASGSGIRHPVGVFPYVLTKIATQLNI